jgi:hypothetical protein
MKLSKREIKTLLSVASNIIPEGGAISYSYKDIALVEFVNKYLKDSPLQIKWLIRFNLWFIEYFSWLFIFTPVLFSRAKAEVRERIMEKLRNSRYFFIRGIHLFVSVLLLIPFYNDKKVWDEINYRKVP